METTKENQMHHATAYENLTINLEEVVALLQLYSEHREEELGFLTAEGEPSGMVKMYLDRERMADALLTAIQEKVRFVQDMAQLAAKEAYAKAMANR